MPHSSLCAFLSVIYRMREDQHDRDRDLWVKKSEGEVAMRLAIEDKACRVEEELFQRMRHLTDLEGRHEHLEESTRALVRQTEKDSRRFKEVLDQKEDERKELAASMEEEKAQIEQAVRNEMGRLEGAMRLERAKLEEDAETQQRGCTMLLEGTKRGMATKMQAQMSVVQNRADAEIQELMARLEVSNAAVYAAEQQMHAFKELGNENAARESQLKMEMSQLLEASQRSSMVQVTLKASTDEIFRELQQEKDARRQVEELLRSELQGLLEANTKLQNELKLQAHLNRTRVGDLSDTSRV